MDKYPTATTDSPESVLAGINNYRVAQDLAGDWWIWRRTSNTTWTTFQRCNAEPEARLVCDELNAGGHASPSAPVA
ncbi:MAG: hypothetical protein AAFR96_05425 [Planctomycetota bacterium]